ncbi:MAG: hypothetical protein WAS25_03510 [Geothrix sp.]|uniref:hypothetical protein n=1 Tax=Geothrix sp. TaxID=1962974 RepID=UPI003BB14D42
MRIILCTLPLLGLLACGGGSDQAPERAVASSLVYTEPASTGWRLVKAPESTATRVVLSLVGPTGTTARGAGFILQADTSRVVFGTFAEGSEASNTLYIKDGGVFDLYSLPDGSPGTPDDPILLGGYLKGGALNAGSFAKQTWVGTPRAVDVPLFHVAVELKAGTLAGDVVPLTVLKAKILPAEFAGNTWHERAMRPITIAVGTLAAR